MRISDRVQQLNLPLAPIELRRRIADALDAEDRRLFIAPPARQRPRVWLRRWSLALATLTAGLVVVALLQRLQYDSLPPSPSGLMGLPRLAELPSNDALEVKRWLESYVDYPVDVPTIRDARLSGGQVLRLDHANAVAVTYQLQGRPLTYMVMPTARVMGRQLAAGVIDTISLHGFNAVTWVETGSARVLMAPMPRQHVAEMAEQCRKGAASKQ